MRPAALAALWIAILILGLLPFTGYADAVPTQPDSIKWITNAALSSRDWSEWTFQSSHFVGYRPLTALSFTANVEAFGPSADALRITDLALHLLGGLAVGLLALRIAGPLAGTVALAWFLGHPGTDEVLPFLARRSYSLAVLCAFAGLLLCVTAVRSVKSPRRWSAGVLVGPLLMGALFANELGAVLALALPVVAFAACRETPWRRTAAVTAWGWAWLAVGVWIRQQVLQGDSGYEVQAKEAGRTLEVLRLYALAIGGELRAPSTLATVAGAALGLYYACMAAFQGRSRERILPLGFTLVLLAYGAIVAREAVWFPRQVYPATALVALIVGVTAAQALRRTGTEERRIPKAVHWACLACLFALAITQSPVVRGTDPGRLERAELATSFCQGVLADIEDLEGPAHVQVVVPMPLPSAPKSRGPLAAVRAKEGSPSTGRTTLRVPVRWLRFAAHKQDRVIQDVLYVADPNQEHAPTLVADGPTGLQLPEGVLCHAVRGRRVVDWPSRQLSFPVPAPKANTAERYLWIYGPNGGLAPIAR